MDRTIETGTLDRTRPTAAPGAHSREQTGEPESD
eukprot:gene6732-63397_t